MPTTRRNRMVIRAAETETLLRNCAKSSVSGGRPGREAGPHHPAARCHKLVREYRQPHVHQQRGRPTKAPRRSANRKGF
jgi:hypothetical protein